MEILERKISPVHLQKTNSIHTEVCIVGGGLTGSSLAAFLGKHQIPVVVIEKEWNEVDRIVGELLQPGGVQQLKNMGIEHVLEGIDAQPVYGYSIFRKGKSIQVAYPLGSDFSPGMGFRNGKFVQNIRALLDELPSVTKIHGNVTELIYEGEKKISGVKYVTDDGTIVQVDATLTVICDGIFSHFREQLNAERHRVTSFFAGLVLENVTLPFPFHGHVFITEQSPFLIYPITSTSARMLIDFPGDQPPRITHELKSALKNKLMHHVPDILRPSFIQAVEQGKIKIMPNHKLNVKPIQINGAAMVGDALNMRHPLTGGGMTVAFTDVYQLGTRLIAYYRNGKFENTDQAVQDFYSSKSTHTGSVNILADALYGVMSDDELSEACFDYLARGGSYAAEPVSLLSAISRSKSLLIKHFFAVAWLGAFNKLKHSFSIQSLQNAYRMIGRATILVRPLLLAEKPGWILKQLLRISNVIYKS
jgi:squalene monooxygenase